MSNRAFFTDIDVKTGTVITALIQRDTWGLLGDWTIAKDDTSVSVPIVTAAEIAAETIRLLLDEEDLCNCEGRTLSQWLGAEDADNLGYLLSRIADPEDPTFTVPHPRNDGAQH